MHRQSFQSVVWDSHQDAMLDSTTNRSHRERAVDVGNIGFGFHVLARDIIEWKLDVLALSLKHIDPYMHKVPQRTLVLAAANDLLLRSKEEAKRLVGVMLRAFAKVLAEGNHAVMEEPGTDLLQILRMEGFYLLERKMTSKNGHGGPAVPNRFGKAVPIEKPRRQELENMYGILRDAFRLNSPAYLSTLFDGSVVQGLDGIPDIPR